MVFLRPDILCKPKSPFTSHTSLNPSPPASLHPPTMEEACSCAICHDLLIDCVETPCCTVGYCRACITKYFKTRSACPICRKAATPASLKPNKLAQRITDSIPMGVCENAGCKAKLYWGNIRQHEADCDWKPVSCCWSDKCKIIRVRDQFRSFFFLAFSLA